MADQLDVHVKSLEYIQKPGYMSLMEEVVMTISVEMESELLSALKSVTIDESRSKLKRVHSRLNELRAYVFGSVEVGAELADRLKTAIPELPPTKRQLEDLPSAGDEYENVSVPGDSDEEKSMPRYAAEWNPLICNGGESDYSDCECDIHRILAESDED
ncbi:hypothetical protein R1sor_003607 [Riccia sorocarpa]|uniref:Uncharacterized protein n=1 Tax=Riccia sorocarpa TaxID=122646 RepID=A0ABD3H5G7_9MARC